MIPAFGDINIHGNFSAPESSSLINATSKKEPNPPFEDIVKSGLDFADTYIGPDPDLNQIKAKTVGLFHRPKIPSDMPDVKIVLQATEPNEAYCFVNKMDRSEPTEWGLPFQYRYPTDSHSRPIKPIQFKWTRLQATGMTLKRAIEVAQEAGYPPPWRKMIVAIPGAPLFPGGDPDEIVYDLKKTRDGNEGVAVGTSSGRTKYYKVKAESPLTDLSGNSAVDIDATE